MQKQRMQYKGASRDIAYNPWMRLVHGQHYDVEVHEQRSGKIRARVSDEMDTVRVFYSSRREFDSEWC